MGKSQKILYWIFFVPLGVLTLWLIQTLFLIILAFASNGGMIGFIIGTLLASGSWIPGTVYGMNLINSIAFGLISFNICQWLINKAPNKKNAVIVFSFLVGLFFLYEIIFNFIHLIGSGSGELYTRLIIMQSIIIIAIIVAYRKNRKDN
ncbi:MAG: hypothetical protein KGZ58_13540 [Ignavibacteriales bacterium]|nr:hypothetical protein [Ignavibacteriales bacterium]